jgi:HEAT repeat protein
LSFLELIIDLISKHNKVLSMKFTNTLQKALIDEVVGIQASRGVYFEEDNPPAVEIETKNVRHWIWISTRADYEGATWDPSTDRLKGDPYSAHVFNNWIGEAKSAPKEFAHLEELDKWALIHTEYEREYTDVGSWGVHKGRWIESITPDGIVTLRIHANRRFQDVSPIVETTSEQFDINLICDISFDNLIQLLEDENAIIRELAATHLGSLGDSRAVDPFLIHSIEDDSQYVSEAAIDALGQLGGEKAIEKLIQILVKKGENRKLLMRSLVRIGEPALDSLSPLITSDDERLSIIMVQIIEAIGGVRSFDILFQALEDKRSLVRARIIKALGNAGNTKVVDVLIENLQDENPDIQQASAQALGRLQDKCAIGPLIISLLDNNYRVRADAAQALSLLDWKPSTPEETALNLFAKREWDELVTIGDGAIDIIIRALNDENQDIRDRVIVSLSQADVSLHDPRVIESILEIYEKVADKRRAAIIALGKINLPQVVRPLIRIYILEEKRYLQNTAFESIEFLVSSGVPMADTLIQMLMEKEVEKFEEAELQAYLKLFTVVSVSLDQLKIINPFLRLVAEKDSTKIASKLHHIYELFSDLSDVDKNVRENAVELLGESGLPSATTPLIEALKDSYSSIRKKAANALGSLGNGALPFLLSALTSKNRTVRLGVVEALGRLRDQRVAKPLMKTLMDQDRIVRQNSAWALGRFNLIREKYNELRGEVIQSLTTAMTKDEYLPVRFNAVYSLGWLDDIRIVKPLLKALFYPEFEIRLNASYGFMQAAIYIHDKASSALHAKIIDNLTKALSDEVNLVRYNAADAIRLNGGPKALEILTSLLKDEDEYIRKIAETGVQELTPLKGKRLTSWSFTSRDKYGRRYRYELSDSDAH